ncbi:MAG: hypothetical protein H0X71_11220 [Rubrobacter sp.]|nr:hypothetical protein [Rubrobacter sp.]
MESVQELERARTPGKVRTAGVICAVGGAGWLVNGVLSLVIIQPVGPALVISEVFWIVIQSLLLIGVVGLALSGAAPGWFGGISLGLALLGRVDFVVAEVHSLIIGYDSDLLPLGALITAVGMTLVGIAVLRAKRWGGWRRFTPLLAGIYPFVAMFPFIFVTGEPNELAIAGWGLLWLLLGYAIWSSGPAPRSQDRRAPVGTSK